MHILSNLNSWCASLLAGSQGFYLKGSFLSVVFPDELFHWLHLCVATVSHTHCVGGVMPLFNVHVQERTKVQVLLDVALSCISRPNGHVHVERLVRFILAVLDTEFFGLAQRRHTWHVAVNTEFRASLK